MRRFALLSLLLAFLFLLALLPASPFAHAKAETPGAGVGIVPQGIQSDVSYASSYAAHHVTNVFATTQQTSCFTPEVPYAVSNGPNDGYSGETACNSSATQPSPSISRRMAD